MDINELSSKVIGGAIEVHKALGLDLFEAFWTSIWLASQFQRSSYEERYF